MNSINRTYFFMITMWLCVTMFYCYQYILRIIPNLIMPVLFDKFGIGAKEFGAFAGIYYIGYIAVHIPIGLLLDRSGSKAILPTCIILTSLGLIPIIYTDSWLFVLIGRFFTGVGSSAAIVGALQIFRVIFPKHFSQLLGLMVCVALITAVYSSSLLSYILDMLSIKIVINILIVISILLALITYYLLPKSVTAKSTNSAWQEIKIVICNYKLLIASILAGLMVGPLEGFADAWSGAFIHTIYGINLSLANSIGFSILTGMCGGCIILPYLADKYNRHYTITIISGICMILCFIYLLSGQGNASTLNITCLIIGVCCAYQVVIISKISTYVSENLSGMAGAVTNMIIMTFGFIFHNVIGFTMDALWDGVTEQGIKIYSYATYINVISIIPAAIIIATIGFVIIAIKSKP